jgi:hypothetical protein
VLLLAVVTMCATAHAQVRRHKGDFQPVHAPRSSAPSPLSASLNSLHTAFFSRSSSTLRSVTAPDDSARPVCLQSANDPHRTSRYVFEATPAGKRSFSARPVFGKNTGLIVDLAHLYQFMQHPPRPVTAAACAGAAASARRHEADLRHRAHSSPPASPPPA